MIKVFIEKRFEKGKIIPFYIVKDKNYVGTGYTIEEANSNLVLSYRARGGEE